MALNMALMIRNYSLRVKPVLSVFIMLVGAECKKLRIIRGEGHRYSRRKDLHGG
jgi:hypothetical protein